MTSFGEKALGSASSMAHETSSFHLHGMASFGKRWYWVILGNKTVSSSAVLSFLSEMVLSSAGEIRIFLILSSASSSSSRSGSFSEISSSSSSSSSSRFDISFSGSSSFGSSSSHGEGMNKNLQMKRLLKIFLLPLNFLKKNFQIEYICRNIQSRFLSEIFFRIVHRETKKFCQIFMFQQVCSLQIFLIACILQPTDNNYKRFFLWLLQGLLKIVESHKRG
jgi:hypothetical protein